MTQTSTMQEALALYALPPLPANWLWSVASDVCSVIASGSTPKSDKMYSGGGDVPFIKVYNLTHNGLLDFSVKPTFVDRATHLGLLARSKVIPNDVLINIVGPPLGKVSIVPPDYPEWNINQAIVLFRPLDGISSRYLAYALLTDSIMIRLTSRAKATAGQYNIGVGMCRSILPIPVAPANEQRRIVAKIEELFSDLDAGVAALERVKAKLKRYRAAVLKAAVEGKLTAEWRAKNPPKESAAQLLERVRTERRREWECDQLAAYGKVGKKPPANWKTKYREPLDPDTSDLPSLPKGWIWVSLDSVTSLVADIDHNMPKSVENGVKFLSAKDLLDDGTLNFTRDIKLISNEDYVRLSRKACPRRNDIIYSRIGARLGKARLVETDEPFLVSYSCCTVRPLIVSAPFLAKYLDCEFVLARAMANTQSIGVPDLGLDRIKRFAVPLCSLAEQGQIVSELEECLSVVAAIRNLVDANMKRSGRLRQSILKLAFNGKLVLQDPNDEPASVLLARVAGSRLYGKSRSCNESRSSRQPRA
jgi:type I restriction enzyme S subunit